MVCLTAIHLLVGDRDDCKALSAQHGKASGISLISERVDPANDLDDESVSWEQEVTGVVRFTLFVTRLLPFIVDFPP
jgi:hypothetical protein